MGVLSGLWGAVILGSQRTDLATIASQLDQLASGQGYIRPDTIPSPRSFTESDPDTRMAAWEAWYNGAPVSQGTLPPTSTFGVQNVTAPAQWTALVALAAARDVPQVIRAYLSVQGATWDQMRPHWSGDGAPIFSGAERAAEQWWYTRLGGTGGTPAPFPRGDASGTPTGGAAGVPTAPGGGMSDGMKLLGLALVAYALKRKGR